MDSLITHDILVAKAKDWLLKKQRCYVVLTEVHMATAREIPDAIGFTVGGYSILVECKVSRSDFCRDKKKGPYRVGRTKYYLVPGGLISPSEVPKPWGLLFLDGKRILVALKPQREIHGDHSISEIAQREETGLLVGALRRPGHPGVHVRPLPGYTATVNL